MKYPRLGHVRIIHDDVSQLAMKAGPQIVVGYYSK